MLGEGWITTDGSRVMLAPYLEQFVPQYHEHMKDPEMRKLTCTELLSLEEERRNQESCASASDSNDQVSFP